MKKLLYRTTQGILICCLAAALPAFSQDSQQQPEKHPAQEKQTQKTQQKAQKPAAKAHTAAKPSERPAPAEHNASRPQPQNHGAKNTNPAPSESHARTQPAHGARPAPNHHAPARPAPGHANHARPAQWGHPPAHRSTYQFRSNDRTTLHTYYQSRLGSIDRGNRPVFVIGGYFPYADIDDISPLPPDIYGELPPPPDGYEMGYYDGYIVVYDPVTFYIAEVIDLLQ
jgi:hypothetical protein